MITLNMRSPTEWRTLRACASRFFLARDGYRRVGRHKHSFLNLHSQKRDDLKRLSVSRVRAILEHAYESTAYYHATWKSLGFDPFKAKCLSDVAGLPFVNKATIERYREEMISNRYPRAALVRSATGGTGSTPTSFYLDPECAAARKGRQLGILELCGYREGRRCALVWGAHQDLPEQGTGRSFKRSLRKWAAAKEVLPCTIMEEAKLRDFYNRLMRFRPRVLYGYPNAMCHFARYLKESGLMLPGIDAIICTAERLHSWQRRLLTEVFEAEVFDLYCSREHGCIGFECAQHNGYHIDVGSVFLEVVDRERPLSPGETGSIVVTDLLNRGMPMIRYLIGDRGALAGGICSCGCELPLLKGLDGREADLIVRPDGSTVAGLMIVDLFMDEPAVRAAQTIQEDTEHVVLKLVTTPEYTDKVGRTLEARVREILGPDIAVRMDFVDDIPRNPRSGKYQDVISKVGLRQASA